MDINRRDDQRNPPKSGSQTTRLIGFGSAALCEGFNLMGFETYPDATPEVVEKVLGELIRGQQKTLVFLEHDLAHTGGPWLSRARNEEGRILVTEVPPLQAPGDYHASVDDMVRSILGPAALETER